MELLARLTTCSDSTEFLATYEAQVAIFLLALALAKFRRDKHNRDFDLGAEPPHFNNFHWALQVLVSVSSLLVL